MKTLKKVIALLTSRERKRGVLVLLLVMGMALFESVGVASVMPFLAVLGDPELIHSNAILNLFYMRAHSFGITTSEDFLIILGVGAFVLLMVSSVYRAFTHYVMNHYIEMRRHSIGVRLLETYLRQPYAFFLGRHSSDMSKTILSEVDQLIGNVIRPAYNMVAYSFVLIAITVLLFVADPYLALLAASLLGGLYLAVFLGLKNKLAFLGGALVSSNKERFMAASEVFGGIKEIKLLGHERSYLSRFQGPSLKFAITQASNATFTQVPKYLIEAFAFGGVITVVLVLMINSGGLSNGALGRILPIVGLYTFSAYRLQPALQYIFQGFASLRYGQAAIDNIYTDLKKGNNNASMQFSETASAPLRAQSSIALRHLSYTYPKAAHPTLIDLNLDIPVGGAIGLVGSTGAGKTTLVDIILGLLRPTEGAITVDDVEITDVQLRAWQQSLGYVPQEIFLTDTSVAENIALGVPPGQIDQKQVVNCARMAQVHDFIMEDMPAQYETLVGERGVRLSGGQRQRIGIARALYRNPEVLIFDEATSALDTVTERAVMDAIDILANQKTIILITHRLSTVKKCGQIVLLENGRIKATGTFDEMVENVARFRSFVNG